MTVTGLLGWFGIGLIVLAFYLNTHGYVSRKSRTYLLMNIAGSVLFGLDLYTKSSWSGVALQTIWILVALSALLYGRREKPSEQ